MDGNSTGYPLYNPSTVLVFLPAKLADQYQAASYVYVACLSGFIWDWLSSLPEEYRMLHQGIGLPIVAYFLSRIGTLGYCLTILIFQVISVTHCQTLLYIAGGSMMLSQASTSYLFFVRVKAICSDSKRSRFFFGIAWLVNLGLSATVPLAMEGEHIGPTNRCIITVVRSFGSAPLILNITYDTLIFITISLKIIFQSIVGEATSAALFRCFLTGKGLPWLSKGLLQSGQVYYFIAIVLDLVMCTLLFVPGVQDLIEVMFSVPTLTLPSIMACRTFRYIKLGYAREFEMTSVMSPISGVQFTPAEDTSLRPNRFDSSRYHSDTTKTTITDGETQSDYGFGKLVVLVTENAGHPSNRV